MPDQAAPAAAGQQQNGQQRQQQGGFSAVISTVLRFAVMWYVMSYMRGGQQPQTKAGQTPSAGVAAPLYSRGELLDLYVYLSEDQQLIDRSTAQLVWLQQEVGLATTAERTFNYTYTPSEVSSLASSQCKSVYVTILMLGGCLVCTQRVRKNGTLYSHVVIARSGLDLDMPEDELPPDSVFVRTHSKQLTVNVCS